MGEFLVNVFSALILGVPLVGGATVTGNQQYLCERMGGTWTPHPTDGNVCPGGSWVKFWRPKPTAPDTPTTEPAPSK